jgi:ferredoxin-NADP reductase
VPVAQKLTCIVTRIVSHTGGVYSVDLQPERPAPRFRPGQFLHLAIDPYDPSSFWPESRVFSIASGPESRSLIRITYAVHGRFTARMEAALAVGRQVWIKLPYGDFVIDDTRDVVLLAGGTGITAFTAFLEELPAVSTRSVTMAYGARSGGLLVYRDVVDRCLTRVAGFQAMYFVESEEPGHAGVPARARWSQGRVSIDAVWPAVARPLESIFYVSGPPLMLESITHQLRARGIASEAIRIDAWE